MFKLVTTIPLGQLKTARADGISTKSGFEIFGRLSKPSGWVMSSFEFSGKADEALGSDEGSVRREIMLPLEPGPYQLVLIVKDIGSGLTGTEHASVMVPTFDELAGSQ